MVTAGNSDQNFLFRLSSIFSKYETLIACYTSSALVFAATLGLRLKLFSCPLYHYETQDCEKGDPYASQSLNKFTQLIFNGEMDEVRRISGQLLGNDLIKSPDEAREAVIEANRLCKSGSCFYRSRSPISQIACFRGITF